MLMLQNAASCTVGNDLYALGKVQIALSGRFQTKTSNCTG